MISLKKLSMLAIALVIGVVMMSCTKEGPAGPAGTNGKDGGQTCGVCHSGTNDKVNTIFSQYDLSLHNKGIVYEEEAGRLACGGCHSGDGFAEAVEKGLEAPTVHASSKINCKACHPIHTAYSEADFSLRVKTPTKMRIGGAEVDLKEGNTCARCHQGRTYTTPAGDTTLKASGTSTYSRFGPHYGTPANVLTMNGPYQLAGAATYPTSNPHASLPKGCVSCHMGSDATNPAQGGHTFLMTGALLANRADCYTCHDKTQLAAQAVAKDVKAKLVLYRQKLIDKGWLDISQTAAADGSYQILGEYFAANAAGVKYTNEQAKLILNYLYVAKDRSFGAHNPKYVQAIINNGLEILNKP